MGLTRRLPKARVRIVKRDPADYAQELQEKLEELERMAQGIPGGFFGTAPSVIQAGATPAAGSESDGWLSAGATFGIETAAPSHPTGTAAAEGTGTALMRADATIKQGIVAAKGDILTHNATVPAALSQSGVVDGDVLTKDSLQSTGLKWAPVKDPNADLLLRQSVESYALRRVLQSTFR